MIISHFPIVHADPADKSQNHKYNGNNDEQYPKG